MKQEAAQLSDEELKEAVIDITSWHKTGILSESSSVRRIADEFQQRLNDGSMLHLHGAESAILFQAAQRWLASLDKWQPIETAPTSGNTVFWAYPIKPNSLGRFLPETIFIVGEVAYNRHGSIDYADYSHWMPIPEPKQK